jgi:hypothetical protein
LTFGQITFQATAQDYFASGIRFFNAVKINEFDNAEIEINILAEASQDALKLQLDTEAKAKAFWINIYNTFVQYLLKKNPQHFQDRSEFFKTESIIIARQKLSLDDIEHGIIRHSINKYSLGYFGSFLVSDFEYNFRLQNRDYRIHFALNCGAKSCPPVALYTPDAIELQLDKSTQLYLQTVVKYNSADNIVWAPRLCSWYAGDFGGERGIIALMEKHHIIPKGKDPDIEYLDYDWTLKLSNYINL